MLTKEREAEIRKYVDNLPAYLRRNPQARKQTRDGHQRLLDVIALLDAERQTVAKLRERIEKLRTATIKFADISFEQSPWGRLMRDAITEDDRLAKEQP